MSKLDGVNQRDLETEIIRRFIGVPYLYKGRTDEALDCWGLLISIYAMLGVELFDIPAVDYSDTEWSKKGGNFLAENLWRDWDKIESPQFLDGILFRNVEGVAYHCGIILLDGRFIHCGKHGVQVNRWTLDKWKNLTAGYYRLKRLHE